MAAHEIPKTDINVTTTTAGTLACFVPQPSSNSPQRDTNDLMSWTEIFKGPYELAKDVLAQCHSNITKRSDVLHDSRWLFQFDAPDATLSGDTSKINWIFQSGHVQQLQDGQHCTITFEWAPKKEDESQYQENPDYVVWNFSTAATQLNVLAFCSNGMLSSDSSASRIQTWWNQPNDIAFNKPDYKFQNTIGANKIEQLNEAEIAIAKKLEAGSNPVYHYPVITKTEYYLGTPNIDLSQIDHITELSGCPYNTSGWEWLNTCVNSTFNEKTRATTVSYQYTGSKSWDINFYGSDTGLSGRWEVGKVTTNY